MKINKRGSQQPQSNGAGASTHQMHQNASASVFNSRKNSLKEPSSLSTMVLLQQQNNLNSQALHPGEKVFGAPSESQPVLLAKANDKPQIMIINNPTITKHQRNSSHLGASQQVSIHEGSSQQTTGGNSLSGNNTSGAYMLKLQKYKKMKNELHNQTKSIIKKCLVGSQGNSLAQHHESSKVVGGSAAANTLQVMPNNGTKFGVTNGINTVNNSTLQPGVSQTTKNSNAQQIFFNSNHIEPASKENTNLVGNSLNYMSNSSAATSKFSAYGASASNASIAKFSINNMLNDMSAKAILPQSTSQYQQTHQCKLTSQTSEHHGQQKHGKGSSSLLASKNLQMLTNNTSGTGVNGPSMNSSTSNSHYGHPHNSKHASLASSKMMMALHKKCNSTASTSNVTTASANTSAHHHSQHQQYGPPQVPSQKCSNSGYTQKQLQNASSIVDLENYQSVPQQQHQQMKQPLMQSGHPNNQSKKNLGPVSQIEFFDENVRVNQVPQITPRHQDKKKNVQPNERYKNIDSRAPPAHAPQSNGGASQNLILNYQSQFLQQNQQIPLTTKNESNPLPLALIQDLTNVLNQQQAQKEAMAESRIAVQNRRKTEENGVKHNSRYQENQMLAKGVFEIKRRSCGPQETTQHQLQQELLDQVEGLQPANPMMNSQKIQLNGVGSSSNVSGGFGLRKFSQQLQFQNKLATVQEEISSIISKKASEPASFGIGPQVQVMSNPASSQGSKKTNPKEEIITYISKYIKHAHYNNSEALAQDAQDFQETVQNLRDFLQYLEDKSIINCKQLENNQEEMNNLIKDLMKLDLNKFTSPATAQRLSHKQTPSASSKATIICSAGNGTSSGISLTCKNSPSSRPHHQHQDLLIVKPQQALDSQVQFGLRRNSADVVSATSIDEVQPGHNFKYGNGSPVANPLPGAGNIVCYYSPINVNGNGNVINTNFQICPSGASGNVNPQAASNLSNPQLILPANKAYNCSQKLFNSKNNSIEREEPPKDDVYILNSAPSQPKLKNIKHKRVHSIGNEIQSSAHQQNQQQYSMNQGKAPLCNNPKLSNPTAAGSQSNQLLNFGFANSEKPSLQMQQQQQQQQYIVLESQTPSANGSTATSKGQHFHQRKHSLFGQIDSDQDQSIKLRDKFYQQSRSPRGEDDMDSIGNNIDLDCNEAQPYPPQKAKQTHRRATTNLIKPSIMLAPQTLQPQPIQQQVYTNPQQSLQQINSRSAVFNDDVGLLEEREKLVKYITHFTSISKDIPITTPDYYKFMKLIGKGAFGKVTLGIHKLSGKQVAIKTVDKSLMKDDYQRKKVLQEVHLLKKVRHANVIRLLEVFESPQHLLMVMEYAGGGDLLQYVKKRRRLEEIEARRIFKQIVYGLAHCHCRSVLHRDIKLDNILLDHDGEIKICDFGVSRVIKKNQRITEQCGTPAYIAPEIISDTGYEGFAADIWSLGVLLYAMVCGTVPFKAQNMHDLHQIITSGQFMYPPHVLDVLSPEVKDLINRMLILNPKERISIPEILSHPWMTTSDDQIFDDEMLDRRDMLTIGQNTFNAQINDPSQADADLNQVNVDNLFPSSNGYQVKLSYTDYCAITQDFATMHMNEEALQVMEGMGFPRKMVRESLNKGDLNHATATYNLLVLA